MTSVNEENAIIRERARIREAVVKLPTIPSQDVGRKNEYLKRADVLAIINTESALESIEIARAMLK